MVMEIQVAAADDSKKMIAAAAIRLLRAAKY